MARAPRTSQDRRRAPVSAPVGSHAALADHRPAATAQRALRTLVHDGPRLTAQRQRLQAAFGSTPVVQRVIPVDTQVGTTVYIKRSTEREFHGEPAVILGRGPDEALGLDVNEFLVEVGKPVTPQRAKPEKKKFRLIPKKKDKDKAKGKEKDKGKAKEKDEAESTRPQVIARSDQLARTAEAAGKPPKWDVDTSPFLGLDVYQVHKELKPILANMRDDGKEGPPSFRLGGSFVLFMRRLAAGEPARTPRDIDLFVDNIDNVFAEKEPFQAGEYKGLPLEFHDLPGWEKDRPETRVASIDTLLARYLTRVREQAPAFFGPHIPTPPTTMTAAQVLAGMKANNAKALATENDLGDRNSETWIKSLHDIQALVDLGAELDVYNTGKVSM